MTAVQRLRLILHVTVTVAVPHQPMDFRPQERQQDQMSEGKEDGQWWHVARDGEAGLFAGVVASGEPISSPDWHAGTVGQERRSLISPPTIPRGAEISEEFLPAPVPSARYGATLAAQRPLSFAPSLPQDYSNRELQTHTSMHSSFERLQDTSWFRPITSGNERPFYGIRQERTAAPTSPAPAAISTFIQGSQLMSPFRLRLPSTPSLESAESQDSLSSQTLSRAMSSFPSLVASAGSPQVPPISSAQAGSKKKSRRSPGPQAGNEGIDEDRAEKVPLPQNLRGDPFRSAKVKTELCRNYNTEKGCPFGVKCNYAHGEHELKYTKLMDLERAGLVDIEIFRTRPCPAWVSTGACPFDQRCQGLHDSRISGLHPSWLPHAETLINSIGSSVNIDKLYHQQLSAVYSCSPIYGYIPQRRWKSDAVSTLLAWNHFYAFVCNFDVPSSSSLIASNHGQQEPVGLQPQRLRETDVPEIHRVAIALKMRERRIAQCYAYLPTHLFCGELCMVLQSRRFRIIYSGDGPGIIEEDLSETSSKDAASQSNGNRIIMTHEIAFGPVGDPSIRQISVLFNVPPSDLVPCTPQQAKRHKRSRHRLKKNRQREKPKAAAIVDVAFQAKAGTQEDSIDSNTEPPFYNYQPVDGAAFDLVTDILRHRLRMLTFMSWERHLDDARQRFQSLVIEEHGLQQRFESQRRFWMTWSWPVNMGMDEVDDITEVPQVCGMYHFSVEGEDDFRTEAFHGVDDGNGPEVLSLQSKFALGFIWKSFVANIQLDSGTRATWSKDGAMPSHDEAYRYLRRLPIFRLLSMSMESNQERALPLLSSTTASVQKSDEETVKIESLLDDWDTVISHYEKNQTSPLRSSQGSKDTVEGKRSDVTASPAATTKYDDTLSNAARQWTRMPL